MARPKAKELTARELEIMHIFWEHGDLSAQEVRDRLADSGDDLAYTTVATLVRILLDKGYLLQLTQERPFVYRPLHSHEEVSSRLLTDLIQRVFSGSREQLLVRLLDQKKLSPQERDLLQGILKEPGQ